MPKDKKQQPHWDNDEMADAWLENTSHKDWSSFSKAMLASGSCPSDYTDSLLRRQVGLMKYQFAKAGYDAPDQPEVPTQAKRKTKTKTLAERLGLTENPEAIDAYKKEE